MGMGSTPHAPPPPSHPQYLRQHPVHRGGRLGRDVPRVGLVHHQDVEGALLQHHVEGGVGESEGADVHDGPAQAGAAGVAGAHGRDAGGREVDAGDVGVAQLVQVVAQGAVAAACEGARQSRGSGVPAAAACTSTLLVPRSDPGKGGTGWGKPEREEVIALPLISERWASS